MIEESSRLDDILIGTILASLITWGGWMTRKAFESHECNKLIKAEMNEIKTEIKGELEVLRERMKNIIDRLE